MRNWRWGAHTEEIQQGADWLSSKLLKDTTWWAYFGKQKEVKPGERVTRRQFPIVFGRNITNHLEGEGC